MFHYVRPTYESPGIQGILETDFRKLLQFIDSSAEFVDPVSFVSDPSSLLKTRRPKRRFLLTFDDGLLEQSELATSIMAEFNARACFFVNSRPYRDRDVLPIHRWHFLRERLSLEAITSYAQAIGLLRDAHEDGSHASIRWDSGPLAELKYRFNYVWSADMKQDFVNGLSEHFGISWPKFEDVYISDRALKGLVSDGHVVGPHGDGHVSLSLLSESDLHEDLRASLSFIASLGGSTNTFAYPFGKAESFSPAVVDQLRSFGVNCAFTSSVGVVTAESDLMTIPRLDPKDIRNPVRDLKG